MTTLRSGRTIQKPNQPLLSDGVDEYDELEEDDELEESHQQQRNTKKRAGVEEEKHNIPVPFPSALQQIGKDKYQHEIQEIFNKCSLNIPLLEAIKQVPKYAKYLKDLCTVKLTLSDKKEVLLSIKYHCFSAEQTPKV